MKYSIVFILLTSWVFLDREPGALRAVRDYEQFKKHIQTL